MANNNLLEIQQQRVDNAKSIIVDHLNINSIRNKFILAESIVKDFSIHQRYLQVLMTKIYKIVNCIAPPIMNYLFTFRLNQHNLRNFQELSTEKRNNVNYGLETVTYWAPIIWAKLPSEYKLASSLTLFKSEIKSWKCEICTCRFCKEYEPGLGYI